MSSLAKTICRAALFIGLLIASSHVDVAAAYWQSGGTSAGRAVHVSTMRVSIAKVVKAPRAAAGSCDTSDFTLTQRTIAVGADVPDGRGTGSWSGGTVAFNNKPGIDQNACQGATVKLRYTTS